MGPTFLEDERRFENLLDMTLKTNSWNPKMEVDGRWIFLFISGWFSGSMIVLGVYLDIQHFVAEKELVKLVVVIEAARWWWYNLLYKIHS